MGKLIMIKTIGKNTRKKIGNGKDLLNFLRSNILEVNNSSQIIFTPNISINTLCERMEYISNKLNKEDEFKNFTLVINDMNIIYDEIANMKTDQQVDISINIISKIDKLISEGIDIVIIRDIEFLNVSFDENNTAGLDLYIGLHQRCDKLYNLIMEDFNNRIMVI